MITAHYFDGRDARLHAVELETRDGALAVAGEALARVYPLSEVRLAEPFAGAPCVLYFNDGARCEARGEAAQRALAEALGFRPSRVLRWQEHWYAALAALIVLVAIGAATMVWGIPLAAEKFAGNIPPSADKAIGENTLRALEKKLLGQTRLSDQRVQEVERVFAGIVPAQSRMPLRVLVRSADLLGANALALPDGTIVITDGMLLKILDKRADFGPDGEAALAGVLAHEIGHVVRRHSVRVMARSSLTTAASMALFGDFSAVAAGAPAVLMNMRYSRDMESDADGYAIAALKARGIALSPMADLFDGLEAEHRDSPARGLPTWMTQSMEYMSSHPSSAARSARLRAADTR